MVVHKNEQLRLKGLVTEAIANLCKNGLTFRSEFCIEGLLGITLDNDDIFLINIKETVTNDRMTSSCLTTDQRDLCDLGSQASLGCSVADTNFLMGAGAINTSLDFSKTGLLCDKTDKQDAFQLNALDLNITNSKLSDLEMLFDLSTTPGKKRDLLPMDMTTSFLDQEQDVEQLIHSKDDNAKEEDGEMSDASDLVVVKEERHLLRTDHMTRSQPIASKPDLPLMSFDSSTISSHPADTMFLNFKGDDQLAGCSGWESSEYLDSVPLNLSEPQDVQPQDLSTNQTKQKSRHVCDICGKKFRSDGGLTKHREKEHIDLLAGTDVPQALTFIRDTPSQPLDLTTGRGENDDIDDFDQDLHIGDHEPFTCICSKVINDYESYVDHVTNCSKSKLTPCKSCEICGKYFFSNSGYVKHKRLHVGAYKFHCDICHKGFFDRTHMSAHMDSSHSKVRRYECEFCKKSFFWKHHLKRHKNTCDKAKGSVIKPSTENVITEEMPLIFNDKYSLQYPSSLEDKAVMKIDSDQEFNGITVS